ncbi:MAG: hypothetical protein QXQ11_06815 [Candidatus Bathyarchaeia archaeon]
MLKYLGASPILRIIDFFLDNPLSDYSKNEIVKNLGMGRVTFFKSGAVKVTRKVGRATMYKLDRENEIVKKLIQLDMALARKSMEKSVEEYRKPVAMRPQ